MVDSASEPTEQEWIAAVLELLKGVIPEKQLDIETLWLKYSPRLRHIQSRVEFTLESGAFGSIQFSQKDLDLIWLIGFTSWQSIPAVSGMIVENALIQKSIDLEALGLKANEQVALNRYSRLLKEMQSIKTCGCPEDYAWPSDIPHPDLDLSLLQTNDHAARDITLIAAAFVILHEFRHVQLAADAVSATAHDEELECDAYALNMILSGVGDYSGISGEPFTGVLSKRSVGVMLGMFVTVCILDRRLWAGTKKHPPLKTRFKQLCNGINLPGHDNVWVYVSSVLIALLHCANKVQGTVQFTDPKDLAAKMIDRIE